jgi:hypothetical protein
MAISTQDGEVGVVVVTGMLIDVMDLDPLPGDPANTAGPV